MAAAAVRTLTPAAARARGTGPVATLHELAPAKVNLYLHVHGRRADGYHRLESLIAFASVADALVIVPASGLTLHCTGPFAAALPEPSANLVWRAAEALAAAAGIVPSAAIRIEKRIPVAAGLGGGSADAAAALRALARLWQVRLGRRALADVARRLGADVPVCLAGRPAWVGGIGERQLRRAHHGRLPIVLVNPGVPLATTAVFRAFDDQPRPRRVTARHALPAALGPASALARYLAAHTNDLEAAATALVPAIADVLAALGAERGCRLARLSGSGPTCFGLFDAAPAARAAAARLRRVYPEWWAVPAHLQEHR